MASSSSSSSSCYDVFLSFGGEDVRNSFLSHLYEALVKRGIRTFKDDEIRLKKGSVISHGVLKAIKESRFFVVVLSKEYASSPCCLDELQTILEHKENCSELEIIPIFYHVEPSEVRHQTGRYGEALHQLFQGNIRQNMAQNMLIKWKEALTHVANFSGFPYLDGSEPESIFIKRIVREISLKLNRTNLEVAEYPVGLDFHLQQLSSLLDMQSTTDDVRFIGIHGQAGIGKTTIAKHIYNLFSDQFEGHVFLSDIKEELANDPLKISKIQKRLLRRSLKDYNLKVENADMGINLIKERLGSKKVLVILDDVDSKKQLRKLAGSVDWFGHGSRILMTTRNIKVLKDHGVHRNYEVGKLNIEDSKRLLCWNIFKRSFEEIEGFEKELLSEAFKTLEVNGVDFGLPSELIKKGCYWNGRLKVSLPEVYLINYQEEKEKLKYVLDRLTESVFGKTFL